MPVTGHEQMERRVEGVLADALPQVELLELTVLATQGGMLRLVVDHPDGVDHEVCVAVTRALDEAGLLEDYGAEVWSPGPEPPLRTPDQFRRAVGRRVQVVVETRPGAAHPHGYAARGGRHVEPRLSLDDDVVEIALLRRPSGEHVRGSRGAGVRARAIVGAVVTIPVVAVEFVGGSSR